MLGGKLFIDNTELEPHFVEPIDQSFGIALIRAIVEDIVRAVPIDQHPVDARELHQQQMIFDQIRIAGTIGPDQRIIMRGDLSPAVFIHHIRIAISHGPMQAPVAISRTLLVCKPRQIVRINFCRLGLDDRAGNTRRRRDRIAAPGTARPQQKAAA